jgi:pyruvate/2-oxoglutarate/acetoin dehydrogenase E1 component
MTTRHLGIAEALREAIAEEMARDQRVFCIGEDIAVPGGWGGAFSAEIAASVMEECGEYLRCPIRRVASADVPVPFTPVLENVYRPDAPRIVEAAGRSCGSERNTGRR